MTWSSHSCQHLHVKNKSKFECKAVEVEENLNLQQKDTLPEDYPEFGERPETGKAYDFKEEVAWLLFQFNLRDVPFTKQQQFQLLNLLYDNQQVFSLHDDDLGFCNKLAHTIFTTTDRPVYLPHRTMPQ